MSSTGTDWLPRLRPGRSPDALPRRQPAPTGRPPYRATLSEATAYVVFVLVPLPFGSVEPIWIATWCGLLAFSLTTADFSALRPVQRHWLLPVPLALAAVIGLACVQSLTAGGWLPADPIWAETATLLGEPLVARPIPAADPPWRALGPSILFALAFTRAFLLATDRAGAERLLRIVGLAGLAYAVYGIASAVVMPNMLLWRVRESYVGDLTATFVNRNTAATFFGCLTLVWLAATLRALRRVTDGGVGWRPTLEEWFHSGVPNALLRTGGALALCLAAVAMTNSRAGFLLTLLCAAVLVILWVRRMNWDLSHRLRAMLSLVAVTALVLELSGGTVMSRISERGLSDLSRTEAYAATLSLIGDHPWLGVGLGGFAAAFPSYRRESGATVGVYDRAHSVPLEIAAELGLPGLVIIMVAWLAVAVGLVKGCLQRRRDWHVPITGLSAGLLGTLHGLIDFSLQIPGYSVLFAVLTATGLAQSFRSNRGTDEKAATGRWAVRYTKSDLMHRRGDQANSQERVSNLS